MNVLKLNNQTISFSFYFFFRTLAMNDQDITLGKDNAFEIFDKTDPLLR